MKILICFLSNVLELQNILNNQKISLNRFLHYYFHGLHLLSLVTAHKFRLDYEDITYIAY
jgi:hypothetical protein